MPLQCIADAFVSNCNASAVQCRCRKCFVAMAVQCIADASVLRCVSARVCSGVIGGALRDARRGLEVSFGSAGVFRELILNISIVFAWF